MLRAALLLTVLCFAAAFVRGESIVPDSLYLFEPGTPLGDAIYHIRLKPDKYNNIRLSIYWNYTDNDHYSYASLEIPPVVDLDNTDAVEIQCDIYSRTGACEVLVDTRREAVTFSRGRDAGFSVLLHADRNGSRLCFGDRYESDGLAIDYQPMMAGCLGFVANRKAELLTHTLISRSLPVRLTYDGTFVASDDPLAGMWQYLDRDSDATNVAGAIDYPIAVVEAGDGSYILVYQGADSGVWHCGDIKGRLIPTPFTDHYDLEWYDADGRLHNLDTSADVMLEGQVIRLNFPLLSTTLRLRRTR